MRPIYLDYNATTPVDPAVAEAMQPYIAMHYGNPSSAHVYGRTTKDAVEAARGQVADLLGCAPEEVMFTGGGSESNNTVLKGVAYTYRHRGNHIITSQVEHPATINPCQFLEQQGLRVTYLPVDRTGMVDPDDVRQAITPQTILLSIMHANNEVGTLQPIAEIAEAAHERGVLLHTDAAQSVGKIATDVDTLGVDLLTVTGHKMYAPKGVGALYVRTGTRLDAVIHGGGHEHGLRAGTENVPYIVGLGAAAELAAERLHNGAHAEIRALRDRLHATLADRVPGLELNGHPERRLPNTLNVSFPGRDGERLLAQAPSIAAATGSACHSGRTDPSSVLTAMGLDAPRALGAVRLSLGYDNTAAEIDEAARALTSHG